MLRGEETRTLLKLLLGGTGQPLNHVIAELTTKLPRSRLFVACSSLCELLSQRACDVEAGICERIFIQNLLASSGDVLIQSAADYIQKFDPSIVNLSTREHLQQQYCNKVPSEAQTSTLRSKRVSNILPDPDMLKEMSEEEEKLPSEDRDEAIEGLIQHFSVEGLGPKWVRPRPPRLPVMENELMWLNPDPNYANAFLWDHGMCGGDTGRGHVDRDVIAKAPKGPPALSKGKQVLVESEYDKLVLGDTDSDLIAKAPEVPLALSQEKPVLVQSEYDKVVFGDTDTDLIAKAPEVPLALSLEKKYFDSELVSGDTHTGLKGFIVKALARKLLPSEEKEAVMLSKDSELGLVYDCGLTPDKLPELVKNSPLFASSILIRLADSEEIAEYLKTLVTMDMSINSMKVVSKVNTEFELPVEFLHFYITTCILSCYKMSKDPNQQTTFVKLLCVFLQSLLKNKIINVKEDLEIIIEVRVFCKKFSQTWEADGSLRVISMLSL